MLQPRAENGTKAFSIYVPPVSPLCAPLCSPLAIVCKQEQPMTPPLTGTIVLSEGDHSRGVGWSICGCPPKTIHLWVWPPKTVNLWICPPKTINSYGNLKLYPEDIKGVPLYTVDRWSKTCVLYISLINVRINSEARFDNFRYFTNCYPLPCHLMYVNSSKWFFKNYFFV